MKELGFAIIGSGMIARYHATAIANTPGARLVAMAVSRPERVAQAQADFGVPAFSDLNDLLKQPDVDVVCIATPSGLHKEQGVAAARAGKHILVEKPIALSLEDADELIEACKSNSVKMASALQRRTDPNFAEVRAAIEAGELGRLVMGNLVMPYMRTQAYYDSAAWRGTWALDGGGALMNQGIHLVDLLVWFMGDVAEVYAHAATLTHQIEVEDNVTASLRFKNGALGSILATTSATPGFPHRVEVYGDVAGVQLEGENVMRWEGSKPRVAPASEKADAGAAASPTGISTAGHTRLIGDLVDAIHNDRTPMISGEEGRRALSLILAVYESARTGRPVTPR